MLNTGPILRIYGAFHSQKRYVQSPPPSQRKDIPGLVRIRTIGTFSHFRCSPVFPWNVTPFDRGRFRDLIYLRNVFKLTCEPGIVPASFPTGTIYHSFNNPSRNWGVSVTRFGTPQDDHRTRSRKSRLRVLNYARDSCKSLTGLPPLCTEPRGELKPRIAVGQFGP